ncbi:ferredoxin [Niallia sp. NCCP-28]|uniref:ferredoxin n=1 Tax=Niallia sp. NCCP-28 TaxID=2934712 RepID=UPI0020824626|nr:ferredoxin [Niallia sp. NCCP-28]GKU81975.1 ferredoxin [Niallia sp. NCCP-28]
MATYTIVDKHSCTACAACGAIAPDIFDFDDDGKAEIIMDQNTGSISIDENLYKELKEAKESCPAQSIKIAAAAF